MPDALVIVGALALIVASYWIGGIMREQELLEDRTARDAELAEELQYSLDIERRLAFARAAQAVAIWPHRVDRRPDLARHIDALGSAPVIGATAPTVLDERPEDTLDDEPATVHAYRQEGLL